MTREQVDTFEKLQAQLGGLHTEISALSKKSQNAIDVTHYILCTSHIDQHSSKVC